MDFYWICKLTINHKKCFNGKEIILEESRKKKIKTATADHVINYISVLNVW